MATHETFLSLTEIEILIRGLEKKYGFSTDDFHSSRPEYLAQIEEDDIFKWYVYVSHRSELRRANEQVRDEYLSSVESQGEKVPAPEDQLFLAA